MFNLEDLESSSAEMYYEIIAANTLDELEHVLMTHQFYDAEGFLSSDAIKKLFGMYTLVYKKDGKYVDIHPNFMKLAISEEYLFCRIIDKEIPYRLKLNLLTLPLDLRIDCCFRKISVR